MAGTADTAQQIKDYSDEGYKYGFFTDIETETAPKGLSEDISGLFRRKNKNLSGCLKAALKHINIGLLCQNQNGKSRIFQL